MPRKKKRSRRRKTWSILNGLEALTYAQILSMGTTGGGVWDFFTGATDLGYRELPSVYDGGLGVSSNGTTSLVGTSQISLGDMMSQPTIALDTMASNFQSNIIPMSVAAFTTHIGFRVGRRLLRRPLSMVTRDIIKPVFGPGVRM